MDHAAVLMAIASDGWCANLVIAAMMAGAPIARRSRACGKWYAPFESPSHADELLRFNPAFGATALP